MIETNEKVRLISLGGFGKVTNNMFVYEYWRGGERPADILIVDCGMGFPTDEMLGVDLLVPDVSYLADKKDLVRGIVISHGHEDHHGALAYILPQLGKNMPIYASALTGGLIENKLLEFGINIKVNVVDATKRLQLGAFGLEFARVTHSIPDALHILITTPVGRIYHGSDFKFDWTPVDGKQTDVGKIAEFGNRGVKLTLSDCLRVERGGSTPSEQMIEQTFEQEMLKTRGRFLVTTMSSNISRWQQAINVSLRHGRKLVVMGRSVEQNLKVATELGYLRLPPGMIVNVKKAQRMKAAELTYLIAGSQAQLGSSLQRAGMGEHDLIQIAPGDKVVFSTDYIPGNELAIHNLIDELVRRGAEVSYHEVTDDLHVSGHGSRSDLAMLIALTRPGWVLPIGGTWRHMKLYGTLAEEMGYKESQVLMPETGQTIEIWPDGRVGLGGKVPVREIMVDGLGVGDVGSVVLRDRQTLAEEGVVVVVVQIDQASRRVADEPVLLSRGVTFGKEREGLFSEATGVVMKRLSQERNLSIRSVRELVSDSLERFFYEKMGRRPMILPMVMEV